MAALTDIQRFVRAVRWRLGMARALERVGAFVAMGGVLAALLIPLRLWTGGRPWWLTVGVVGGSAVLGLITAWRSWPTRLAAAMEADRQFQLDDLLSSAWLAERGRGAGDAPAAEEKVRGVVADTPWAMALLAEGAARCRSLRPRELVARRWGGGRWGGLTLGIALLLTLSAWWSVPELTRGGGVADGSAEFLHPSDLQDNRAPALAQTARGGAPEGPGESSMDGRLSDRSPPAAQANTASDSLEASQEDHPGAGAPGDTAAGSGSAQTPSHPPIVPEPSLPSAGHHRPGGPGPVAGGTGAAAQSGLSAMTDTAGQRTGDDADHVALWMSDHWEQDRAGAEAAVRQGRVPDAYRAMVRAYFSAGSKR